MGTTSSRTSTPISRWAARDELTIDRDTAMRLVSRSARSQQHARRRLRPASGFDYRQRPEPVSRRHGDRAAYWQDPRRSTRSMFRRRAPIRPWCNRRDRSRRRRIFDRAGQHCRDNSRRISRATSRRTRSRPAAIPPLRLAPPLLTSLETMVPLRPSPNSSLATPRSASITRDNSPHSFRRISPRAARSAKPRRRSTKQSSASACLQQSEAHSPAPRRPFSNRNRACRFCSALRW